MLGGLAVSEFTPSVTTAESIIDWVGELERERGRKIDVLVVDYLDRVGSAKAKMTDSSYRVGELAAESLRTWALKHGVWVLTAAQARRVSEKELKKRALTSDDCADSMGKVRVADYVFTMNYRNELEGKGLLDWFVAKNRYGIDGFATAPSGTQFAVGRVCARDTLYPDVPECAVRKSIRGKPRKSAKVIDLAETRSPNRTLI
jgi:replicative DNA helicase